MGETTCVGNADSVKVGVNSTHSMCIGHVYALCIAGFCPHWSGVVSPNHHSAFFTTTQAQNGLFLPPLRENNSTKMLYSMQYNTIFTTA